MAKLKKMSQPPAELKPQPSQKIRIVELSEKGKTIDEIAELTGIKKSNIQWYFSKLKLKKKK